MSLVGLMASLEFFSGVFNRFWMGSFAWVGGRSWGAFEKKLGWVGLGPGKRAPGGMGSRCLSETMLQSLRAHPLQRPTAPPAPQEPAETEENKPASRWKRLAEEAEESGDLALAAKYHQERLVHDSDSPTAVCAAHFPDGRRAGRYTWGRIFFKDHPLKVPLRSKGQLPSVE